MIQNTTDDALCFVVCINHNLVIDFNIDNLIVELDGQKINYTECLSSKKNFKKYFSETTLYLCFRYCYYCYCLYNDNFYKIMN